VVYYDVDTSHDVFSGRVETYTDRHRGAAELGDLKACL
jgi:hypothetical protein